MVALDQGGPSRKRNQPENPQSSGDGGEGGCRAARKLRRWTGLPVSWERWDPEQRAGWGTDIRVTGLFRVGVLAWTSQAAYGEKQD